MTESWPKFARYTVHLTIMLYLCTTRCLEEATQGVESECLFAEGRISGWAQCETQDDVVNTDASVLNYVSEGAPLLGISLLANWPTL